MQVFKLTHTDYNSFNFGLLPIQYPKTRLKVFANTLVEKVEKILRHFWEIHINLTLQKLAKGRYFENRA
ncbi:hypothetical protein Q7A_03265 [Methylophaga nitratireducenticrescens]|nr:hypothetical protein Q7A_03265 [Methylophaga nitratireducenticrescens]